MSDKPTARRNDATFEPGGVSGHVNSDARHESNEDLLNRLWTLEEPLEVVAHEAAHEIERLNANIKRLSANPADYRYWEGRWRDEVPRWQPIETAPKDTAILVYHNGWNIAHYNTEYGRWCMYTDGTRTAAEIMMNRDGPTHWMHLPDAPDGATAPGKKS